MGLILTLAIIVIALFVLGAVVGGLANILWTLLVGLVIGAVARLVVPGRQAMGWLSTMLAGVAGALVGGVIASAIGWETLGTLVLSIISAAALVALIGGVGERGRHVAR